MTMPVSTEQNLIVDNGFRWASEIDGMICLPCENTFSSKQTFYRHLRKFHNIPEHMQEELRLLSKTLFSSEGNHTLKTYYKNPTGHTRSLPPIKGLPIVEGARRCNLCNWICPNIKSLIKHSRNLHGYQNYATVQSVPAIHAQGLLRAPRRRTLYAVSFPPIAKRPTMLSRVMQRYVSDDNMTEESNSRQQMQHESTTFMNLTCVLDMISTLGLTMEQLADLTSNKTKPNDSLTKQQKRTLKEAVLQYHDCAKTYGDVSNFHQSELLTVAVPGTYRKKYPFQYVEKPSVIRYARCALGMILMLSRVLSSSSFPNVSVPNNLQKAAEALFAEVSREDPDRISLFSLLHDVLFRALICDSSAGNRPKQTFFFAYQASILVKTTEKGAAFSRGVDVSSTLSGIAYFASCCAIVHLTIVVKDTEGEDYARRTIIETFSPGSRTPIGMLSRLRGVCKYVRESEQKKVQYRVCSKPQHRFCAILGSVELSIGDVGSAARKVQSDFKQTMFSLVKVNLTKRQVEMLDEIKDDHKNLLPGYSFMTDKRNQDFFRECRHTVADALDHGDEEHPDPVTWFKLYKKALELFMTLLHLTGGAPGRGTELLALYARNTNAVSRNIYVNGPEFITAPGFFKQRNRAEKCKVLTRHLDLASSRLVKVFLVLVRPVYIAYMKEMKTVCSPDLLFPTSMFQSKSVDKLPSAASIVTTVMKNYGIDLTFSQFRQFQAGYSLRRTSPSHKIDTEGLLTQAGHTSRTARKHYGQDESLCGIEAASEMTDYERFRRASRLQHIDMGIQKLPSSP